MYYSLKLRTAIRLEKPYYYLYCSKFLILAFITFFIFSAGFATAGDNDTSRHRKKFGTCSATAKAAFTAATHEIRDDYWVSYGKCQNLIDPSKKEECLGVAGEDFQDSKILIKEQFRARKEVCSYLGEEPYDPVINSIDFVDFEAVLAGEENFTPQSYFPLVAGTKRIYLVRDNEGKKLERIKVEVLPKTKNIIGINCIVVRDRVWEFDEEGNTVIIEDTEDWYAQDILGNVWYFGEIAKNYEDGELIDLEGSWKSGREYDMPGIIMLNEPQQGEVYRQEFSLGNAEDMAEIIGYVDNIEVAGVLYSDVVKTLDYTPIDPAVVEYKYYAPGVGLIKEEKPEGDEILELVRLVTP